jgi:diguanylate cyclase (GGDEF)-like protein
MVEQTPEETSVFPAGRTPTVMVVDDDAAVIDILRQSLAMEGMTSEVFTRAEDALAFLERQHMDVLLTDIVMPGMPGLELVRRAKQLYPGLTAIVMTGFVEDFTYEEAIRSGAVDFIKKPFTAQELLVRIKHARLQEHIRELSMTDELTGLANRRGFFAFAQQQLKQARRTKERLVLLYADLDNLKTINDTHGHLAGDRVLADAARIFRDTFRESDIIARMGGDEFAMILMRSPETGISAVRSRLQQRIDEYNARRDGALKLSVSLGIAIYEPDQLISVDELVREADARMYEEKQRKKKGAS